MQELDLLLDLLWVFGAAIAVVLGLAKLRMPSIAGFILAGALIGPHAIGLVRDMHAVQRLAEVGVMLLLFGVGLEMPVERLRQLLRPMLVGGALQVGLSAVLAFLAARAVGLEVNAALAVAILVAPSSTAIVLRGLEARGELDAPHGQLMLGILLFQDLCVVPMMLIVPALGAASAGVPLLALGKSVLVLALVVASAALFVPRALHVVALARQRDAFVLAVVVSCLGTAYAASLAGVSLTLGAFLGGVVVAGSAYRHQTSAELAPIREVLSSLFFVSVGMLLDARLLIAAPLAVFGSLAAIVLGKALVVVLAGALMRLPLRVSVAAGVGLAQLGEFALVLAGSVEDARLVSPSQLQPLLTAATLSMFVTPLLLVLGPRMAGLAQRLPRLARLFGVRSVSEAPPPGPSDRQHVVIAGFGVAGETLVHALQALGVPLLIVDLNAASIRAAGQRGLRAYFGDISSRDMLEHVGLRQARELVLLINDPATLERAVLAARSAAPSVLITVRVRYQREVPKLRALGADEVVVAEVEAGDAVVRRVLAHVQPPV